MRILVPMDGSDNALRALAHVMSMREQYKDPIEVNLVNVQRPIASGNVKAFISQEQLHAYYQDEGTAALKQGRDKLAGSGLAHRAHVVVGDESAAISEYARTHECRMVVMGTRGMGSMANLLLGSVAARVVHLSPVPVMLVK